MAFYDTVETSASVIWLASSEAEAARGATLLLQQPVTMPLKEPRASVACNGASRPAEFMHARDGIVPILDDHYGVY